MAEILKTGLPREARQPETSNEPERGGQEKPGQPSWGTSKSAGASQSAAALVQAKQRELVKQYVQDWGFSHRQAFEEAKKNHPNVFAVDAVDLSTVQRSA
jgi:hypothetical protein